ncbi:hypothetical protein ND926_12210 [Vibrio diabolicus]|uniref:hypothetical protein n=1 Tax=Vibrio harveyi group TaxID=717610 RepID=UPI000541F741|nr:MULTISPECIES: hypothetical protein [Vibrio harveyi group]KHF13345.1 hypothetical protein PO80_18735 [Vibrio parahaemolyticus]MCS0338226.1 hypothetical protein [Vibrio diabolicus]OTV93745.1 hypothetical protein BA740_12910 [Vibrio parahaemolyticus]OTV93754.1 hypothetical protein BA740_12955 [Vibrio parahaemolyticus]OTW03511.1 hypothetical protein BA739_14125 [Vibrio parahaemolyticus]
MNNIRFKKLVAAGLLVLASGSAMATEGSPDSLDFAAMVTQHISVGKLLAALAVVAPISYAVSGSFKTWKIGKRAINGA